MSKPILKSEPIAIPNAKKCRENHGLVAAIPCEDMTFGVFRRSPTYVYKMRIKSLEKRRREIERRNCEIEKAKIALLERQPQEISIER